MPFNSFDDYPMNWRPDRESLGLSLIHIWHPVFARCRGLAYP